ncbi:MAG: DNA-binding protein [Deltaproteobacteria bacterium]|nr:DNA-binding protein [Deltaproteobacteria bacterium]
MNTPTPYNARALPPELQKFRFITEQQVSLLTGRALQSLRNDRHVGKGFPYRKLGKSVRYALAEILAIMDSYRVEPERGL